MNMKMLLHGGVAAAALMLGTATLADDLTIERIAPDNAFLVIGTKNLTALKDDFGNTGFARLWEEGPVRDFIEQMSGQSLDDMDGQLERMLAEAGLDPDELVMPSGAAGFAMFMAESEQGMPMPAMLSFADYGADSDKFRALFEKMLVEGAKNEAMTYETTDIDGHIVYSIEIPDAMAEMPDDMAGGMQVPDVGDMMGAYEYMHFVQHGSAFFASTHMERLVETISMLADDESTEFALRDNYRGISRQIGSPDAYGVFFVQPLMQAIATQQPMVMMIQPMIAMLMGDVQAFGFGVDLNSSGSDLDMTVGVFMPNGTMGLTSLMDENLPMSVPPAFVGPDTIAYSTSSMEFDGLLDVITPLLGANPMMDGEEVVNQINMMFGPMVDALGKRMHSMTMKSDAGQLFALECKDQQAFEEAFAGLAPMMGMEPRDFLGNRIYSMDLAMMGMPPVPGTPDSVGIGGGHVFLGTSQAVERSLRAIADDEAPTVRDEALYKKSMAAIPAGEYVGWGFTDIVSTIESVIKQQQQQQAAMIEEMRQWDPELADEMAAEAMATAEMFEMFDFEALRDYIGPMVSTMKARDDGFVIKTRMLKTASE